MPSQGYDKVLSLIPTLVSSTLNEFLLVLLFNYETKATVFQLGITKAPGSHGFSGLFF